MIEHIKGFIEEKPANLSGIPKLFQVQSKDFRKRSRFLKIFQKIRKIFNAFFAMEQQSINTSFSKNTS